MALCKPISHFFSITMLQVELHVHLDGSFDARRRFLRRHLHRRNGCGNFLLVASLITSIIKPVLCNEKSLLVQSDTIGNNVCFINDDDDDNLKEKCCSAFRKQHYLDAVGSDFCMDKIARIPMIYSNMTESSLVPIYYLHTHSEFAAVGKIENENNNSTTTIDPGHSSAEQRMYSPLHYHPIYYSQIGDKVANHMYQVKHQNSLSDVGGMHRAFVNEIAISLNANQLSYSKRRLEGTAVESIAIDGSLYFIFPILEGYFIDLDDPFQDDLDQACHIQLLQSIPYQEEQMTRCAIEIITAPKDLVIDIEQPSFASKQHVVAFHLAFHVSLINIPANHDRNIIDSTKSFLELKFVPMIHFRYQ